MVSLVHKDPDIYLISVPYLEAAPSSSTNCFVIVDSGEALMIDTGAPTEAAYRIAIGGLKDDLGLDPCKISYFLTHLHLDHSGLVKRLAGESATVYVSKTEHDYALEMLDEGTRAGYAEEALAEGLPPKHLPALMDVLINQTGPATFDNPKFPIAHVKGGDLIRVGRHEFEVIDTPGHSVGHVSLYHRDEQLLFDGDHILFHMNPSIVYFQGAGDGMGSYFESLSALEELAIRRTFVSHDQVEGDVKARIRELRSHHVERLAKTAEIIEAHPGSSALAILKHLGWSGVENGRWELASPVLKWCTFAQTLAILKHLVARGAARKAQGADGIYRYYAA